MNKTTNLELKKPEGTDFYSVADFNDNMDILDAEVVKKLEAVDTTATLTVAGWSNKEQTVQVQGITASSRGLFGPRVEDLATASDYGVMPSAIGNGTVTFTCEDTPDSAIIINFSFLE